MNSLPLNGVKVLDLSTLLPGPLATLMLAETGANVIKLERPGRGDEMRNYRPRFGEASANYAVLNRGKRAYAVDFKDPAQRDWTMQLAKQADIVVEQFRPGVANRLGLGYGAIKAINERVIYCSISGYGSDVRHAQRAGHDLNYLADAGLLGAVVDSNGVPPLPATVIADIAGGTYPAVVNILLALRTREQTGTGVHIEISMTHNLQMLAYGYFATYQAGGGWPRPGAELLTGGSPRYHVYPTSDGRHVACAALEEKFWRRLTEVIGLDEAFRDDVGKEQAVIEALTELFATLPAPYWRALLDGEDVCTVVVSTWDEAVSQGLVVVDGPHRVSSPEDAGAFSALPMPIACQLRREPAVLPYPALTQLSKEVSWD